MTRPAIFLDRDGTINEDCGYLCDPNLVRILPGVVEALSILSENQWPLVIVTNQSGIGRGYYELKDFWAVQEKIEAKLLSYEIIFNGLFFCPHAPDELCACRKPEPGLLVQAANEMKLDLKNSWMIGDKVSDVVAGQRAYCRSILISSYQYIQDIPKKNLETVIIKPNLLSAVHYIINNS
jgi:D-glycero-D-manno-heptose 1,7-bisphosphate phosphatase